MLRLDDCIVLSQSEVCKLHNIASCPRAQFYVVVPGDLWLSMFQPCWGHVHPMSDQISLHFMFVCLYYVVWIRDVGSQFPRTHYPIPRLLLLCNTLYSSRKPDRP